MRIVPQDRQARWDSQKRLAFTPPASLSSNSRSRRASLGLPGGPRKQSSPDDTAVRLPPLTPPGLETPSPPDADAAAVAAAAAAASIRLTSACGASGRAACHVTKAGMDANSWLASPSCNGDHVPGQAIAGVHTEAQPAHSTLGEAGRQEPTTPASTLSPVADRAAHLGVSQSEPAVKMLQLQQHQTQPLLQSQLLAAAAATDTGQIGPPITRMRPPAVPSSPASARKGGSKEPSAAGSVHSAAEAILLDALLCGWEQHNNDGVSPVCCILTDALLQHVNAVPHFPAYTLAPVAPLSQHQKLLSKADWPRCHLEWMTCSQTVQACICEGRLDCDSCKI